VKAIHNTEEGRPLEANVLLKYNLLTRSLFSMVFVRQEVQAFTIHMEGIQTILSKFDGGI
jgi:hypothetical protein